MASSCMASEHDGNKRLNSIIYRDLYRRKQNRRHSRSRSSNICGPSVEKAVQIQGTKLLFKQSSRTNSNIEVTGRTYIPLSPQRKISSRLHRQQSDLSFTEKRFDTQPFNCRNTKRGSTSHVAELVDPLRMGEGTYWNRR